MRPLLLFLMLSLPLWPANNLDIHFVDVEGGQATLIVTPAGQSLLVDTGWPGFQYRDANRIVEAAQKAGLKQIDYVLITHFHTDHVGGLKQLSEKFPIAHVVDHGDNIETSAGAQSLNQAYAEVIAKAKRISVKPGDTLPLKGVKIEFLAANGNAIQKKGSPNPLCANATRRAEDPTENARSAGFLLTYGKFRFLDLGDLTWNKELDLVCPENRIGKVDVYLTTHHGMDASGPAELVHAIKPRVAIMNNGEKKGGAPPAWKIIRATPGLEDLWQVHYSAAGGPDHNTSDQLIANLLGNDKGNGLTVSAQSNGKFTVTNLRNGYSKSY